jgi:hypothetical protein
MLAGEPPPPGLAPRGSAFPPHHRGSLLLSNRRRGGCHDGGHEITAPRFFFISGRQHGSTELITTARSPYKLSPPPVPQDHQLPSHQKLLAIDHQSARISYFTQIKFLPPSNQARRGQPVLVKLCPIQTLFKCSCMPVMPIDPLNCTE